SPIFSGFGELLEGIVTVRAFSAEQRFLYGLYAKVDLTTQVSIIFEYESVPVHSQRYRCVIVCG
ncbi:hypothetical protein BJV77DRAFT_944660, partial [Russula vinacea]